MCRDGRANALERGVSRWIFTSQGTLDSKSLKVYRVAKVNATGRRPGGSELIALDIDYPGNDDLFNLRAIKPVGYKGATGDDTLDLLGFDAQILDGDTIQFYFVNQRPPIGPFN